MAVATRRTGPQKVRATYKMDTETFVLHFNARHQDGLAGMKGLPPNIAIDVEMSYRAFHNRLHRENEYEHEHSPDPDHAGIEWAIHCLRKQRARGWYEIAGVDGLVSCFPDDPQIATRIKGVIAYHDSIKDAVQRLMGGEHHGAIQRNTKLKGTTR